MRKKATVDFTLYQNQTNILLVGEGILLVYFQGFLGPLGPFGRFSFSAYSPWFLGFFLARWHLAGFF